MYKMYFDKAVYILNEVINIEIYNVLKKDNEIELYVTKLHEKMIVEYKTEYYSDENRLKIELRNIPLGNFGIKIKINDSTIYEAFDVLSKPSDAFRYGFLSDFSSKDFSNTDIDYLKQLKINNVQFYDWMFRHDDLIAPTDIYLDPLDRTTDLNVIKSKIDYSIKNGIRPFAYGAVYAATKELFKKNPNWGLYKRNGNPMLFADWLHFMNVSKKSPWSKHILNEFNKSMEQLGFMGIHMDTYGYPKTGQDYKGKEVRLDFELPKLVNAASGNAKKISPNNGVIFNCVNNWPIDTIASSKQDAVYIEVWPPHNTYYDLYLLIRRARELSNKNVVLAAYMHPFKDAIEKHEIINAENSLLLTQAVIMASGGTQLVFGEDESLLCDSYYVNHRKIRKEFLPNVYKYSRFIVKYADILYNDNGYDISMTASNGINQDIIFKSDDAHFSSNGRENTIWTIIRESRKRIVIHLINLVNQNCNWNEPKKDITAINKIEVKMFQDKKIKSIYSAEPNIDEICNIDFKKIEFENKEGYCFEVRNLDVLKSIWIELE